MPAKTRDPAISSNVFKSLGAPSSASVAVTTTAVMAYAGTVYRLQAPRSPGVGAAAANAGSGTNSSNSTEAGGTSSSSNSTRRLTQAASAPAPAPQPQPQPANGTQCAACTSAIASELAASLCAAIPMQNCSLVTATCVNASIAGAASSSSSPLSFPSLPLPALSVAASDSGCSGYVAVTVGYKDPKQQDNITQAIQSHSVTVSGVGSAAPPSASNIAASAQLLIVVANEASANPTVLVIDSSRVAQGVAAAMGLSSDKVSVTLSTSDSLLPTVNDAAISPGQQSATSPSPPAPACDGGFSFGSLCGGAAAGALVGIAAGGVLLLIVMALLAVVLVGGCGGAGDSRVHRRVQPLPAEGFAAASLPAPPVAFLAPPSLSQLPPAFAPNQAPLRMDAAGGAPWARSPYLAASPGVRGEAMLWEPIPWRRHYVQTAPPVGPGGPGPGSRQRMASLVSLQPPWSPAAAVQRRQSLYQAGLPTWQSAAPPEAAAAGGMGLGAGAAGSSQLQYGIGSGTVPAGTLQDFNSLNAPGSGVFGEQYGVPGMGWGGAGFGDAYPAGPGGGFAGGGIRQGLGAQSGAFGMLRTADSVAASPAEAVLGHRGTIASMQASSPSGAARGSGIYRGW
ncbi:hypothetical protein PLESTM_000668700 [Pleodorina starrii]|nr:hypothetical protein PLESTM_000668700 [Pleodorina starrii]